jgi:hypothetical protein
LFSSPSKFLRARVCQVVTALADFQPGITFNNTLSLEDKLSKIMDSVIDCLDDPELIVRYRAFIAIGHLSTNAPRNILLEK